MLWYEYLQKTRKTDNQTDAMFGSYLGPKYSNDSIRAYLDSIDAHYSKLPDPKLFPLVAEIIEYENVVGWFNGRMEFGPRALGERSIIGYPRSSKMQSIMNLKIKCRQSFRPFAPAIIANKVSEWFEINCESPYMLFVAPVAKHRRIEMNEDEQKLFGVGKLKITRPEIPAVTHVDYSARIQTVHKKTNPRFYSLIEHCEQKSGCPLVINTSFNVRGEPIVESQVDAYRCFIRTKMDYLILENFILDKKKQPSWSETNDWKN